MREPPLSGCSSRTGRHHPKCGYLGLWISPQRLLRVARFSATEFLSRDAREIFATGRRFPMADEVRGDLAQVRYSMSVARPSGCEMRSAFLPTIQNLMSRRCGVRSLPVLVTSESWAVAPLMNVGFERLAEAGITSNDELERLMSPVGLDLGARTPEETAISICAEIIANRTGRNASRLRSGSGSIHPRDISDVSGSAKRTHPARSSDNRPYSTVRPHWAVHNETVNPEVQHDVPGIPRKVTHSRVFRIDSIG